MNIQQLQPTSGISYKPNPPIKNSTQTESKTLPSDNTSASEIMARYNLRNISYTRLVDMAGELKAIGALPEEDYLDFIGPSPEFASISGETIPDWNKEQDYVALHEQRLEFMQTTGTEQRFVDFEKHLLSLFSYFESLQS